MRKNYNTTALNKKKTLFAGLSAITMLTFAATLNVCNVNATKTEIEAILKTGDFYVNVSTNGDVDLILEPTPDGVESVATDTITVETNTSSYRLYLSTTSSDTNSNRLVRNDGNTENYFTPTESTTLNNGTWGFSLDTGATKAFQAVPIRGNEFLLGATTAAETVPPTQVGTSSYSHEFEVSYGAKADSSILAGTYSSTILYSVVANTDIFENSLAVYPTEVGHGHSGLYKELTIATSLMTNTDFNDWTVRVGDDTDCINPTSTIGEDSRVSITCDVPLDLAPGNYDIVATSAAYGSYVGHDILRYRGTYLSYDSNGGAYAPDRQEVTDIHVGEGHDHATISMDMPKRNGYGFAGWTTEPQADSDFWTTEPDYMPGDEITLAGDLTLYARWESIENNAIADIEYMHHMMHEELGETTSTACANTTTPSIYNLQPAEAHLIDARNDKVYAIRKLADGNCWMVQNLEYSLRTNRVATPNTTDVTGRWRPLNFTTNSTDPWDGASESYLADHSYAPILANRNVYFVDGYIPLDVTPSGQGYDRTRRAGIMYNWAAATAGYVIDDVADYDGDETDRSICPQGWTLPVITPSDPSVNKSLRHLAHDVYKVNTRGLIESAAPLNITFAGYFGENGPEGEGTEAYFWSGVSASETEAYAEHVVRGSDDAIEVVSRNLGASVRCVAR